MKYKDKNGKFLNKKKMTEGLVVPKGWEELNKEQLFAIDQTTADIAACYRDEIAAGKNPDHTKYVEKIRKAGNEIAD